MSLARHSGSPPGGPVPPSDPARPPPGAAARAPRRAGRQRAIGSANRPWPCRRGLLDMSREGPTGAVSRKSMQGGARLGEVSRQESAAFDVARGGLCDGERSCRLAKGPRPARGGTGRPKQHKKVGKCGLSCEDRLYFAAPGPPSQRADPSGSLAGGDPRPHAGRTAGRAGRPSPRAPDRFRRRRGKRNARHRAWLRARRVRERHALSVGLVRSSA